MKPLIYMAALGLLSVGCSDEPEDVFSQPATQRLESQLSAYGQLLVSSPYGWRLDYTPTNGTQVNFIMDFTSGTVAMETHDGRSSTSRYTLSGAEGLLLSFDTYSVLHELADPSEYPKGYGQGGDYEFVIEGTAQDTIYLHGRKYGTKCKLVKAAEGEMNAIRLVRELDTDSELPVSFFHVFKGSAGSVGVSLGEDGKSLKLMRQDYVEEECPLTFIPDGFRLAYPLSLDGKSVDTFLWDNAAKTFTSPEGVSLQAAGTCPFETGNTLQELLSGDYFRLSGVSANLRGSLNSLSSNFPTFQRIELYWEAPALIRTQQYTVSLDNEVTVTGTSDTERQLSCMSFVVDNAYGLPEWANFQTKRCEPKDADEAVFVEGLRDGNIANTLNRNTYVKNLKRVWFDTQGITVVKRGDLFYVVAAGDARNWLVLEPAPLPRPTQFIPQLITNL